MMRFRVGLICECDACDGDQAERVLAYRLKESGLANVLVVGSTVVTYPLADLVSSVNGDLREVSVGDVNDSDSESDSSLISS